MSLPALHLLRLGPPANTDMDADEVRRREENMDFLAKRRERMRKKKEDQEEARRKAVDAARMANAPKRPEGALDTVRLLVLDFDGTLTLSKEFVVAGVETKALSTNLALFQNMTKEQHVENFGGSDTISEMKDLFDHILKLDVEIRILSKGNKEAIVHALDKVGLVEYFTSTDENGDGDGDRVFGADTPLGFYYAEEEPAEQDGEEGEEGEEDVSKQVKLSDDGMDKAAAIQGWRDNFELEMDEVAFLDNDIANLTDPETGMEGVLDKGMYMLHTGAFGNSRPFLEMITGIIPIPLEDDDDDALDDNAGTLASIREERE